jgi:hypothetical protein
VVAFFASPMTVRMRNTAKYEKLRTLASRQQSHGDGDQFLYGMEEIDAMEKLIVSLSKQQTDSVRRKLVAQTFEGHDQRFAALFDEILIQVGDQVRMQAAQEVQRQEQQAEEDEVMPSFPLPGQQARVNSDSSSGKSETELQLWALIDMLVQSKTIVKKAAGELGSKGRFG